MSKKIDEAEEQALRLVASQPHALLYVDKVLKSKTDGYLVQITLGWKTPNDGYAVVGTAAMPAPFAKELANTLLSACEKASAIRDDE